MGLINFMTTKDQSNKTAQHHGSMQGKNHMKSVNVMCISDRGVTVHVSAWDVCMEQCSFVLITATERFPASPPLLWQTQINQSLKILHCHLSLLFGEMTVSQLPTMTKDKLHPCDQVCCWLYVESAHSWSANPAPRGI